MHGGHQVAQRFRSTTFPFCPSIAFFNAAPSTAWTLCEGGTAAVAAGFAPGAAARTGQEPATATAAAIPAAIHTAPYSLAVLLISLRPVRHPLPARLVILIVLLIL